MDQDYTLEELEDTTLILMAAINLLDYRVALEEALQVIVVMEVKVHYM